MRGQMGRWRLPLAGPAEARFRPRPLAVFSDKAAKKPAK